MNFDYAVFFKPAPAPRPEKRVRDPPRALCDALLKCLELYLIFRDLTLKLSFKVRCTW